MHYRDLHGAGAERWRQREGAKQPYGGRKLIVDTSAWTAIDRSRALGNTPHDWTQAMQRGQLLLHPVVRLELLHHAKNSAEVEHWDGAFEDALEEVRVGKGIYQKAIKAVHELADKYPAGGHRVSLPDALIAASAQESKVGVLHYNPKDFNKLALVLTFDNMQLAPSGTFERG
jgi:predicted nucleic acid-binding protein